LEIKRFKIVLPTSQKMIESPRTGERRFTPHRLLENSRLIADHLNLGVDLTREALKAADLFTRISSNAMFLEEGQLSDLVYGHSSFFERMGIFVDGHSSILNYAVSYLAYANYDVSNPQRLRAMAHAENGPLYTAYSQSSDPEKILLLANYIGEQQLERERLALDALKSTRKIDFALLIVLGGEVLNELQSFDAPLINKNIIHLWRILYENRAIIYPAGYRFDLKNRYVDYINRTQAQIDYLLQQFLTKTLGSIPDSEIADFYTTIGFEQLSYGQKPCVEGNPSQYFAKALNSFDKALKRDISAHWAAMGKGTALISLGFKDDGKKHLAAANYKMGLDFKKANDRERAEIFFRDAVASRDDCYPAWFELGGILMEKGEHLEAIQCFDGIINAVGDIDLKLQAKAFAQKGNLLAWQYKSLKVNYLAIKESLRELRSELLTEERDFRKEAIAAYDSAILFNRRIIEFNRHLEEVLSAYVFMIKMFSAKMEIENFTANAIEILAFSEKALDLIRSNIELIETMPKIRALYSRLLYLQGNALYSLGMKEEALENYLLAKSLQAEDKSAENAAIMVEKITDESLDDFLWKNFSKPNPLSVC